MDSFSNCSLYYPLVVTSHDRVGCCRFWSSAQTTQQRKLPVQIFSLLQTEKHFVIKSISTNSFTSEPSRIIKIKCTEKKSFFRLTKALNVKGEPHNRSGSFTFVTRCFFLVLSLSPPFTDRPPLSASWQRTRTQRALLTLLSSHCNHMPSPPTQHFFPSSLSCHPARL